MWLPGTLPCPTWTGSSMSGGAGRLCPGPAAPGPRTRPCCRLQAATPRLCPAIVSVHDSLAVVNYLSFAESLPALPRVTPGSPPRLFSHVHGLGGRRDTAGGKRSSQTVSQEAGARGSPHPGRPTGRGPQCKALSKRGHVSECPRPY